MFISQSMTRKVVCVGKDENILEAWEKMRANRIHHLPVVEDDDRLLGILSDRDIRDILPYGPLADFDYQKEKERLCRLTAGAVMTRDPRTVAPEDTIEDALLLMQKKRVRALPVVADNGRVVGIISTGDLLRAFVNVLGIGEPGALLAILVEDKIGQLKRIVDAVSEERISIGSVLVTRHWEKDKRAVYPYLLTQNVAPLKRKLRQMGFTLIDPREWHLDRLPADA